jgi:hypothetical protein
MVRPEFLLTSADAGALADPAAFATAEGRRARRAVGVSVSDAAESGGHTTLTEQPAAPSEDRHAWREERARTRASRRRNHGCAEATPSPAEGGRDAEAPTASDAEAAAGEAACGIGCDALQETRGDGAAEPEPHATGDADAAAVAAEIEVFGVRGVLCVSCGPPVWAERGGGARRAASSQNGS